MTLYYVNISHIMLHTITTYLTFFFLQFYFPPPSLFLFILYLLTYFYCIIYLCHITYVYNTILSASQPLARMHTHSHTPPHTHTHTHTPILPLYIS